MEPNRNSNDDHPSGPNRAAEATRADMIVSVALPLVVIALGIVVSAQASGGLDALVDICLSVIR